MCYDGFEPSGRMHIAQGILKAINVNKLTRAGCVFKFWVADYFALLNNKMGGDLKKIRTVGAYMIEVWRAAGMDMENVEFLWASDEINARPNDYWLRVMDIARRNNVPRIVRCCTIMGRSETDDLSAAQIFYPCMQCADIFFLKVRERKTGGGEEEEGGAERETLPPRHTHTHRPRRPQTTRAHEKQRERERQTDLDQPIGGALTGTPGRRSHYPREAARHVPKGLRGRGIP